jgi:hypothetical protein
MIWKKTVLEAQTTQNALFELDGSFSSLSKYIYLGPKKRVNDMKLRKKKKGSMYRVGESDSDR